MEQFLAIVGRIVHDVLYDLGQVDYAGKLTSRNLSGLVRHNGQIDITFHRLELGWHATYTYETTGGYR